MNDIVVRTPAGLVSAMFDEIDLIRSGKADLKRSKHICNFAREILNVYKSELHVKIKKEVLKFERTKTRKQ